MKIFNYEVKEANTLSKRFFGLMGKKEANYGLLFKKCNGIHTFFMRFPLDILFIKDKKIVYVKRNVKPWKIVVCKISGVDAIEIPYNIKNDYKKDLVFYN